MNFTDCITPTFENNRMKNFVRILTLLFFSAVLSSGGVKFDVQNDSPTLIGAKVTFTINIIFQDNHGIQHGEGEPVYPQESTDEQYTVYPDGSSLNNDGDQKPSYVFVWKTCGKYWQVSDGPSSSLTINAEDIPLGSYLMDVVIYHYRKRDKFIPIGYTFTQFFITDQIPFAVTLTQVNDEDKGNQTFIRNHAIAFSIAVHDPSAYLANSDITFNWDFGDESGTMISRELTVTHTYTKTGFFKPHVVVQAAVPNPSCHTSTNTPPVTNTTADTFITEEHAGPVQLISTERASKDMEHSGSINADIKTSPELDTNRVMKLEAIYQNMIVFKKHQLPKSEQDCVIFRYGSFSTRITVVGNAEDVQIVKVDGVFHDQTTLDFTNSCQHRFPTDICTLISKCFSQGKTICSAVRDLPECQLVLQRLFNDSGNFCVNVSTSNNESLSARLNLLTGPRFIITGAVVMVLGILAVTFTIGIFVYKRLKCYQPLSDISAAGITYLMPSLLWSFIKRQAAPNHSVLLHRTA